MWLVHVLLRWVREFNMVVERRIPRPACDHGVVHLRKCDLDSNWVSHNATYARIMGTPRGPPVVTLRAIRLKRFPALPSNGEGSV